MTKRKICVLIHSRANYARIKSFLQAAKRNNNIDLHVIFASSAVLEKYGDVEKQAAQDGYESLTRLHTIIEGENLISMPKSTGLALIELSSAFERIGPDIVLTVADRYETMATAIAASYLNIPLAHTQGGEVSGSIDESVRHAITKLAHIHFPATERARDFIIRMGEEPSRVHLTGCPAIDLIVNTDLTVSQSLLDDNPGVGKKLDITKPYIVVLQHPVTQEYGSGLDQIRETLLAIKKIAKNNIQVIWLWPNVDAGSDDISKGLRIFREENLNLPICFYKNFSAESYVKIISKAICVVGNSSSGIRECAFLGVPSVNIGNRQRFRERAKNVIDVQYDSLEIYNAILKQNLHGKYKSSNMFGDGRSGQRIADILATEHISVVKTLTYLNS